MLKSTGPSVAQQQEIIKRTEDLKAANEDVRKMKTLSTEIEARLAQMERERQNERLNLEQTIRQLNFQLNIISNELKTKDAGILV